MPGRTLIKTSLFRLLAIILLAISAGFVILPESNLYSVDKTFVKSHTPVADNLAWVLAADDKEDIDEDGAVDVQLSSEFSAELISFVSFTDGSKANTRPKVKTKNHHVYLFHRQLLI